MKMHLMAMHLAVVWLVVRLCSESFVPYRNKLMFCAEEGCFCCCRWMQLQAAERQFWRVRVLDGPVQADKMETLRL